MIRPTSIGLAPNLEKEDAFAALGLLFNQKKLLFGNEEDRLSNWFGNYFSAQYAFPFVSARGGMAALLKSQGIGRGDEVLMQGFTCVAVSNAILSVGAKPVYIDSNESFVIDVSDIKKKVTPRTKAIILQHTFGIPAWSEELINFLRGRKLFVIEDVAHTVGGTYKGKKLGTIGDAAVFSLGRDKAFSTVSGGIVITNKKDVGEFLKAYYNNQIYPSRFWIFQQLFHSISFFFFILPLYNFFIGKLLLFLFQQVHLLAKPVDKNELFHFSKFSRKLPPPLAYLALLQLQRVDKFNTYREETSAFYASQLLKIGAKEYKNVPLLRYPLLVDNPKELKQFAKKFGVILGDWYSNVIDPKGTDLEKVFYTKGSCPKAEYMASSIINLPCYPTLTRKEREKVVKIVLAYDKSKKH